MNRLSELAEIYGTDKGPTFHGYTEIYHEYFAPMQDDVFTLLEIGVGGYGDPNAGGESLSMWADYFPNANIHGIDITPKELYGRFTTHEIDQCDDISLRWLIKTIGAPRIIIDDASHINLKTIQTFDILFPLLKEGGYYVIEDTQTAYIEKEYGGSPVTLSLKPDTILNYMFSIVHRINHSDIDIKSIHFYKNLVIIKKK